MPKSISVYVPDDLVEKMDKLPEVNWSEIARQSIEEYIEKRGGVQEKKLQIIGTTEIQYRIVPRWIAPLKYLSIMFYLENPMGFDLILDRIIYTIKLEELEPAFQRPPIAHFEDAYLEKKMLINGGKIEFLIVPVLPAQMIEKILEEATKGKPLEFKLNGKMFFDSPKGVVENWFGFNARVQPVWFLGEKEES
jgi:hypothetical protein